MKYEARVQLKSDTEANWNKVNFIPYDGELVIYSPDATHPYCRAKIGDGINSLSYLDFIDAGTINGKEVEIVKIANFASRPVQGSSDKLYVDLSTNAIYHYDMASGYTQLSNFTYNTTKIPVARFNSWDPGTAATIDVQDNILKINTGSAPTLSYYVTEAVSDITKTPNTQGG